MARRPFAERLLFARPRGPGRRREACRGTLFSRSMRLPLALVSLSYGPSPRHRPVVWGVVGDEHQNAVTVRDVVLQCHDRAAGGPRTPASGGASSRPHGPSEIGHLGGMVKQQYNLFSSDTQTSTPYFVKDAAGSVTRTRACLLALNWEFLQDCAIPLLCVISLDRFGDYVSDQVVAPVHETCAQALGAVLKYMHPSLVCNTLNLTANAAQSRVGSSSSEPPWNQILGCGSQGNA